MRTRARDDISRMLSKQRLFVDHETVDWMNDFLEKFWLIYEPVLSATIVASVDQTLSYSTPAILDSMRLSHFTLGTKAPRIEFVRTHPNADREAVVMDWKVSFTPNDTADLTAREAADKVNPKVVLAVVFGGPLKALGAKNIVVDDIAFSGVMRINIKLRHAFPHVETVGLRYVAISPRTGPQRC